MSDPARVSARAAAPIIGAMKAQGADVTAALRETGFDAAELNDPDARVSHRQVVDLWKAAARITGDPDLGLKASGLIAPGQFGVVEYGFRKSATLLDGLQRVSRYFRINHDVASLDVIRDGAHVIFEHTLPGGRTLPRVAVDFILSNPVLIARDATGTDLSPKQVWVDYAPPDDTTALDERFRAPVRFLRGRRALVFDEQTANTPLGSAEPGLCAILDSHAKQLLEALPTVGSFADRVREQLASELSGGDPTAQGTARALRMSVRTLHRRLKDEGTSHKLLLEQLRKELAATYLNDRGVAISEVAFLLGFSEPSAFHRAFRRWHGKTPSQFRATT